MTVGQYVLSSALMPTCCIALVKDMQQAVHQNVQTMSLLIAKRCNTKCKVRSM